MNRTSPNSARSRSVQRGFTLVELLVSVVIGLALTLALTTIMTRYEVGKRVVTSSNDLSLNAAFISFDFDRQLRSAGAGFAHKSAQSFGCLVHASREGKQILPSPAAFPAPFAALPQQWRLAPLLVFAGAGTGGSDVIAINGGSAGLGQIGLAVKTGSARAIPLSVEMHNTLGLRGNDIVLLTEEGRDCMVQQVAAPFEGSLATALNFGGIYAAARVDTLEMEVFSRRSIPFLTHLGNTDINQPPLQFLGIDSNSALVSYDLLQMNGLAQVQPVSDGVADLRALYGVDSNSDGSVDTWVAPNEEGYKPDQLTDRSAASINRLSRILAVRVGLILRSDRIEKETVSPESITLFDAMPVKYKYEISAERQRQRHRSLEFTVPLRNNILLVR